MDADRAYPAARAPMLYQWLGRKDILEMNTEMERIQALGVIEAVITLMERDAAVRRAWANNRRQLKRATQDRAIALMACEGLGVRVIRTMMTGNVKGAVLPKNSDSIDWLALSLREREPVSVPGLGEDIGSHGYYDPCEEAILNRGGGLDLGTYSFEEWMKNE